MLDDWIINRVSCLATCMGSLRVYYSWLFSLLDCMPLCMVTVPRRAEEHDWHQDLRIDGVIGHVDPRVWV